MIFFISFCSSKLIFHEDSIKKKWNPVLKNNVLSTIYNYEHFFSFLWVLTSSSPNPLPREKINKQKMENTKKKFILRARKFINIKHVENGTINFYYLFYIIPLFSISQKNSQFPFFFLLSLSL